MLLWLWLAWRLSCCNLRDNRCIRREGERGAFGSLLSGGGGRRRGGAVGVAQDGFRLIQGHPEAVYSLALTRYRMTRARRVDFGIFTISIRTFALDLIRHRPLSRRRKLFDIDPRQPHFRAASGRPKMALPPHYLV